MYLQVSITGQLIIFSTRSLGFFFTSRPSNLLMIAFVVAQLVATLIAVYADWPFTAIYPIGWDWAGVVWVYSLIWSALMDLPKLLTKLFLAGEGFQNAIGALRQNFNGGIAHMGRRRGTRRASDTSRMYANSLNASQRSRPSSGR